MTAKTATKRTPKSELEAEPTFLPGIKGMKADMTCLDYKFEVGKTYKHEGTVKACSGGFHAVTGHPLAVFNYYAPAGSRFFQVEVGGQTHSDDGEKTAAEILKVGQEVSLTDLVNEAIAWVTARATPEEGGHATGYRGAASATGYRGAASATGDRGAASATGNQGAASATGNQGAASATGYQGAASATGDRGAASATGDQGAAMAIGTECCVRGTKGNALFAAERKTWNGPILSVACGIVGKDGIKENVWYAARGGKLVERSA